MKYAMTNPLRNGVGFKDILRIGNDACWCRKSFDALGPENGTQRSFVQLHCVTPEETVLLLDDRRTCSNEKMEESRGRRFQLKVSCRGKWTNLASDICSMASAPCLTHIVAASARGDLLILGQQFFSECKLGMVIKSTAWKRVTLPSGLPPHNPFSAVVKQVACGDAHFVVLRDDGRVFACGSNRFGQVNPFSCKGPGEDAETFSILAPIEVPSDVQVYNVACGWSHTLLATRKRSEIPQKSINLMPGTSDDTLYAFGLNMSGQCGHSAVTAAMESADSTFASESGKRRFPSSDLGEKNLQCTGQPHRPWDEFEVEDLGGMQFKCMAGSMRHSCVVSSTGIAYFFGQKPLSLKRNHGSTIHVDHQGVTAVEFHKLGLGFSEAENDCLEVNSVECLDDQTVIFDVSALSTLENDSGQQIPTNRFLIVLNSKSGPRQQEANIASLPWVRYIQVSEQGAMRFDVPKHFNILRPCSGGAWIVPHATSP